MVRTVSVRESLIWLLYVIDVQSLCIVLHVVMLLVRTVTVRCNEVDVRRTLMLNYLYR